MSLQRLSLLLFALLAATEAYVEFAKSRLYDETDFKGQGTVYIPNYCGEGCRIYVSIPDASVEVAQKILIDDFSGTKTSLVDANTKDVDSHKLPYLVKKANSQVNFINNNAGQKSAPIAVWVVRGDAPFIDDVEVYDADDTYRPQSPAGLITIINSEPYVVTSDTDGPMTVSAFTAGFDAFDSADKCTRVLRQEDSSTYQDVRVSVRSPLFTLFFDKNQFDKSKVAVRASKDEVPTYDLAKSMFVTSPGYIGCSVVEGPSSSGGKHTKTYRSSLYDASTVYHFMNDEFVSIELSSDLSIDKDHPVNIFADRQAPIYWDGVDPAPSINLIAKELTITWSRNDADLDEYFMVRVEPSNAPKTTTAEPEPIKTTTMEPEAVRTTTEEQLPVRTTESAPEPVRTTTGEPEPVNTTTEQEEPVRTSTFEPESAKTTTLELEPVETTSEEPELVETTTIELESIKTTTEELVPTSSEPEPIETTTSEPELVKTTTSEPEPEPIETTPSKLPPVSTTTVYKRRTTASPVRTTTSRSIQTTAFHPKSTVTATVTASSTMTTVSPTTSGAGYGSLVISVVIAATAALF